MKNYEYIIASLPTLSKEWQNARGIDVEALTGKIRSLCDKSDNALIDTLEEGFSEAGQNEAFYRKALSGRNRFIREFFNFDLKMKNAKVRFLNRQFERPEEQDIFMDPQPSADETSMFSRIFSGNDILGREKAIDDSMWDKIDEINTFDYFNIDAILGFMAKLHIVDRWLKLDPDTGREMFRRLVEGVRGTFKGTGNTEK